MSKILLPRELRGVHIHFVGIKGTGMIALVEILYARGAVITGSDVSDRFYTDEILEKLHLMALPFSASNITDSVQYIVYSSAYNPEKNPDLIEAGKRKIPCILYTEALGEISETAYSCSVCGVHGKTTTAGLIGTILERTDLPAQILAGSVITSFGGSCTVTTSSYIPDGKNYFVAETCEYQRHFMSFHPQKIVLTSIESDHQDCYPTYNDIRDAFVEYICLLPKKGQLIYCADDPGAVEAAQLVTAKRSDVQLIPYGEKADGPYKLMFREIKDGEQFFTVTSLGNFALRVPGKHMVRNATAACALVCELLKHAGKNPLQYEDRIRQGLLSFTGGRRRSEIIGRSITATGNSVIFIDDYGHHPTAIKTTLEGYRSFFGGRKIIVDFMSHTYTRTAALLEQFAQAFSSADEVILHKIYASARESSQDAKVSGKILADHMRFYHKNVYYFEEVQDADEFVLSELSKSAGSQYPEGYLFVTMGAGDNWKIGREILKKLKKSGEMK